MAVTTSKSVIDSPVNELPDGERNNFADGPARNDDGSLSRLRAAPRADALRGGEGASGASGTTSPHPASDARHPPLQAGEGKDGAARQGSADVSVVSPLAGEADGQRREGGAQRYESRSTPLPNSSPQGGREQKKRDKRDIHGWVILDKPIGMTSTQAVAVVKRLMMAKRAGHAGTLDPLASGGLPIALGEATKTVPFVMDGRKRYRFTVAWGEERDTDDTEGRVTQTSASRPTAEAIRALLPQFTGLIEQTPPQYSAIKIQGERAYDLARDGEVVPLVPRPVEIHKLVLSEQPDSGHSVFEAECGKGTYVRALARDIGRLLGCYGHICALRRTLVGPFVEAEMISLEQLEALCDRAASGEASFADALLPIETALDDIPALAVNRADAARLHRGQAVLLRGRDAPEFSGTVYVTSGGRLLALAEMGNGELIPKRVFNLTGLTGSARRK